MWRELLFVEDTTYVLPLPEKGTALIVTTAWGSDIEARCTSCGRNGCQHLTAAEAADLYHEKLDEFTRVMSTEEFNAHYDKWWSQRGTKLREYAEGSRRYERADAFFQALQDAMKERRKRPNPNPSPDEDALTYLYEKKEVS